MAYCTRSDIEDYVLAAYLNAAEGQNSGIVTRSIAAVSAEMDDALRPIYKLPLATIPATLTRICAVMAGYRSVGGITSLVNTEAASKNDWLPLQRLYDQAVKDLYRLRDEKLDLELERIGAEAAENSGDEIVVVTRKPKFDMRGF